MFYGFANEKNYGFKCWMIGIVRQRRIYPPDSLTIFFKSEFLQAFDLLVEYLQSYINKLVQDCANQAFGHKMLYLQKWIDRIAKTKLSVFIIAIKNPI
jgi:hypothetical protein